MGRTDTAKAVMHARIESRIYSIHRERVMLGPDLAALYAVETGALTRAVKRQPQPVPA
jgi:hypothetical protein